MKIALAGNPNSGKTTLFNAITGKTEYVGNWPGVTVEKKEADLKGRYSKAIVLGEVPNGHLSGTGKRGGQGRNISEISRVIDLPGAYSIEPFTGEEIITRDYVIEARPDVIINIVDASSLERSLFFSTQLLELNIPIIVALNKQDIAKRHGNKIDVETLSLNLNCPVVETVANEGEGIWDLMLAVSKLKDVKGQIAPEFEGKKSQDEDKKRQVFVKEILDKCLLKEIDSSKVNFSDKIDRIVAHGFFGLPIFALIMWAVYAFSIEGLGGYLSEYFNDILFGEVIPNAANSFFESIGVNPLLQSLIVDGAIGGVGAVIGFLPLIMILFFCLSLLEDSGYMARVAVVMDRYFKRIGLSGKSIIPMIVGSGCSIPGVMATRTIEDENERRITTMLTPFVPCGAKLPVIALFSAVFFPDAVWVGPSMYILAIVVIIIGGLILKKIYPYDNVSSFILELPEYKIPSLKHALRQMFRHAKAFIVKASTIILVMNTLIWFLQTYSWRLQVVADQGASILASISGVIAPLLIPLGFIGWQLAASALTGFVAKENVVSTFAIILAVASEEALFTPGGVLTELFNPVTGYAFLVFNLFTPPCFAAIGAMNAEMRNGKWLRRAVLFQLSVGYLLAMFITQIGTIVFYGELSVGFVPAIIITIVYAVIIALLIHKANIKRKQDVAIIN